MIARLLMRAAVRLWPPERHLDNGRPTARCIVRIASGTPVAITAARRRRPAARQQRPRA